MKGNEVSEREKDSGPREGKEQKGEEKKEEADRLVIVVRFDQKGNLTFQFHPVLSFLL